MEVNIATQGTIRIPVEYYEDQERRQQIAVPTPTLLIALYLGLVAVAILRRKT